MKVRARFDRLMEPCPDCGYQSDILKPYIGLGNDPERPVYADPGTYHTAKVNCVNCKTEREFLFVEVGPLPCPPWRYPVGFAPIGQWELDEGIADADT